MINNHVIIAKGGKQTGRVARARGSSSQTRPLPPSPRSRQSARSPETPGGREGRTHNSTNQQHNSTHARSRRHILRAGGRAATDSGSVRSDARWQTLLKQLARVGKVTLWLKARDYVCPCHSVHGRKEVSTPKFPYMLCMSSVHGRKSKEMYDVCYHPTDSLRSTAADA
jgi:hypothetical protein